MIIMMQAQDELGKHPEPSSQTTALGENPARMKTESVARLEAIRDGVLLAEVSLEIQVGEGRSECWQGPILPQDPILGSRRIGYVNISME
jgi:hypothetical protein